MPRPSRTFASFLFRDLTISGLLVSMATLLQADTLRVFPPGERPNDHRLGSLNDLNGYFPFHPPTTKEAWERRSERVRRQLLVANGLWPMPIKTPLNAVVHGRVHRDEYTVEKVYFESYQGLFVSGNLYRPKGRTGKLPGVLCPHGHWADGRFYDCGLEAVHKQIADGAERFEVGGRFPLQARCVQLARMGCVVFHYDMMGYADSGQLGHRLGTRDTMNTPKDWGLFSPQAELRMQNEMGLQTYSSIRALDFLLGLPDVDPSRVAVTGASGGGTQTFILCAVDARPAVAFPAVMVSTAMQGGCVCENACYLRVGTGNIELAALIAPRPLAMTAADDWTKEIATKGLPELKQLYEILGVEQLVMAKPLVHFPHNYNYVSRATMYQWLNRHLELGLNEPIIEEDYVPLTKAEMRVWNDEHPRPPSGDSFERKLLRHMTQANERQMASLVPTDAASLAEYKRIVGGAVDVMIGRGLLDDDTLSVTGKHLPPREHWTVHCVRLRNERYDEELPLVRLQPRESTGEVVVWIDPLGKQHLFDEEGQPSPVVQSLLNRGIAVVGVDLFGQGEFTENGKPIARARLVRSDYAGYTFGYNHPVFAKRVHDILSVIAMLRGGHRPAKAVHLIGLAGAGHWVAAAKAQAGKAVDKIAIDTAGFRFASLDSFDDPDFLPGAVKYGDLPGILGLATDNPLWLAGEGDTLPTLTAAAYDVSGHSDNVTLYDGPPTDTEREAVAWIVR